LARHVFSFAEMRRKAKLACARKPIVATGVFSGARGLPPSA
jgi:hypothetical protein